MDAISNFAARYARTCEEEMSIDEYLAECKRDPMAYATSAQRMLAAIGEPEMVDTRNDPRLSRLFANKVIKRYPAFTEFYGMEESIEQVVSFFRHAAQGLEERKQILYLLGPVGGGKSSIAERLKALMQKVPFYALKGSPVNESPLGLFDAAEDGPVLEEQFGIPRRYLFRMWTDTSRIIDYLVYAKDYVAQCEERYGTGEVERLLDSCHALANFGVDRYRRPSKKNLARERLEREQREAYAQQQVNELWRTFPDIAGTPWLPALDHVMRNFKDESFIGQYLSPHLMREMRLFALHDDANERELVVSEIHDENGYRSLRQMLSQQYDLGTREPNIQVWNVNLRGDRSLTLRHTQYQGRPLADDTHEVLKHVARLWGFGVQIESADADGNHPVLLHQVPASAA